MKWIYYWNYSLVVLFEDLSRPYIITGDIELESFYIRLGKVLGRFVRFLEIQNCNCKLDSVWDKIMEAVCYFVS